MKKLYLTGIVFLISLLAVSAGEFPDEDHDGWCETPFCDKLDNCPKVACEQLELPVENCANPDLNVDSDGDGAGDGCDECPSDKRFEEPCTPSRRGQGGGGGGAGSEGGDCCGPCEQNPSSQCRVNPYHGRCTVIDNIGCPRATPAPVTPIAAPVAQAPMPAPVVAPPARQLSELEIAQRQAIAAGQMRELQAAADRSSRQTGTGSTGIVLLIVLIGIAGLLYYFMSKRR